ncbi:MULTISPECIES: polysaccharide deacetylase family protein [unclassified Haladaptatus]|uniref:polysaccharide deacetylase family protein n=1 Tax=unclassified Haladaptatus TaxID=2622732 RepID=UPI00209C2B5C|nr:MULTISPECIES: polysaccharide deacetylase family protein [unclassified Haladaptatus]MCO8244374.1 polysaccharide deacetylase family protein [Haladaptatus sp. AB643]MCO8254003.1 polysaccharide deacetylase family protein [Haladaptatus sp. AB618]
MHSSVNGSRRRFLRSAGVTGVALTAPVSLASRAAAKSSSGKLVFIYDDSVAEDYTKTFPVHQDEGVPACSAAISGQLGEKDRLTVKQLHEMSNAGWEVMSHTVHHRALGPLQLAEDASKGDTKVYERSNRHGDHPGDEVIISNGTKEETVTIAGEGSDDTGEYVTLKNPLEKSFIADNSTMRYTDEILHSEIFDSKKQLEKDGFDVTSMVLPYGINGQQAEAMIQKEYDALANAKIADGLNPITGFDPYHLSRAYFKPDSETKKKLGTYLDTVAKGDFLGILAGHSSYEDFDPKRVRTAIQMAKDRDIEILTLRDAMVDMGIIEQQTTTTTTTSSEKTTTTSNDESTSTTKSSGQPGFGFATALTGLGALAWRQSRR